MASTGARCSFGTTTRPLASPRTTSPGRTVTPPHCTTTLIAPGPWFDPVAGWAPTANVGNPTRSRPSRSRTAPSTTARQVTQRRAHDRARAAAVGDLRGVELPQRGHQRPVRALHALVDRPLLGMGPAQLGLPVSR